jgi:tRNA/tmRNA/rRNA uracil-C5-methylase (TrmA/RlmC/RlmD family)
MTLKEATNILRHYQLWRLGDEISMLEPKVLTEAINTILTQQDSILESLIDKYKQRSELGIKKYNTTLDRTDLTLIDWINHAQDEAMDLSLYLEKIKQTINNNK